MSKNQRLEKLDRWQDPANSKDPFNTLSSIKAETYPSMYGMHRYWARKPYNIVSEYIRNFTKEGDIVMDAFCGSGVTAIESLVLRRKAIAVDINPMATFITEMTCIPVDLVNLERTFNDIKNKISKHIESVYSIICSKCDKKAILTHTVWNHNEPLSIRYHCTHCGNRDRRPTQADDLKLIESNQKISWKYWHPKNRLFKNSRINVPKDLTVDDLFTPRNLNVLSMIYHEIENIHDVTIRNILKFTFTSSISQASNMVFIVRRRGRQHGKIKITEEVGSRVIGYWVPKEHFEINAWNCFESRFMKILRGKKESNEYIGDYCKLVKSFSGLQKSATLLTLNQSSESLSIIPSDSVDYIFTDPPFGDQVPYLELDALWSYWLGFKIDFNHELVISNSPERSKDFKDYSIRIRKIIKELHRVLKPEKYISIAFHNYDLKVWHSLVSSCIDAGFEKQSILPLNNSHPSIVQLYRTGGTEGSLIITFKKSVKKQVKGPKSNEPVEKLIVKAVSDIILEEQTASPYRIYDAIIRTLINNSSLDEEQEIPKILKKHFQFIGGTWKKIT